MNKIRFAVVLMFFVALKEGVAQQAPPRNLSFRNAVGMEFARIEPGELKIGAAETDAFAEDDEYPAFSFELNTAIWVQKTEVTRGVFAKFCNETGYVTDKERSQNRSGLGVVGTWKDETLDADPNLPITMVSFNDCRAFCLWLSGRENRIYRLPTEPEWEFACRAGSTGEFTGSLNFKTVSDHNCIGKSELKELRAMNPITHSQPWKCGSGTANLWGIFDMHGNVAEIVDGFEQPYSRGLTCPSQVMLPVDKYRVVTRGGSCRCGPEGCRSSSRGWIRMDLGVEYIGFRVVAE